MGSGLLAVRSKGSKNGDSQQQQQQQANWMLTKPVNLFFQTRPPARRIDCAADFLPVVLLLLLLFATSSCLC